MDSRIRDFFTEQYETNWYLASRADVLAAVIRPLCDSGPARRVVDVGAGTGSILAHVGHAGVSVGVETALDLARVGRARHALNFMVADIGRGIPLRDASADVVLVLDVLEHLEDDGAAAAEIFRILRPAGCVVVSVPAFQRLWSRHDELHHHKRRYSKRRLLEVLSSSGFTCTRITYFNTLLFPLVYVSRKLESASGGWRRSTTDYEKAPSWLAGVLRGIFRLEAHIVPRWNLPVGVSLLAVAMRPSPREIGTHG